MWRESLKIQLIPHQRALPVGTLTRESDLETLQLTRSSLELHFSILYRAGLAVKNMWVMM